MEFWSLLTCCSNPDVLLSGTEGTFTHYSPVTCLEQGPDAIVLGSRREEGQGALTAPQTVSPAAPSQHSTTAVYRRVSTTGPWAPHLLWFIEASEGLCTSLFQKEQYLTVTVLWLCSRNCTKLFTCI